MPAERMSDYSLLEQTSMKQEPPHTKPQPSCELAWGIPTLQGGEDVKDLKAVS